MSRLPSVGIFWDFENCPVAGAISNDALRRIRELALAFGACDTFRAYYDFDLRPALKGRSEMQSNGVSLVDCPHAGRKEVADNMMITDMAFWAADHPAPATVILMTGDSDFAYPTSILQQRGYNVVLVASSNTSSRLRSLIPTVHEWADVTGVPAKTSSASRSSSFKSHKASPSSKAGKGLAEVVAVVEPEVGPPVVVVEETQAPSSSAEPSVVEASPTVSASGSSVEEPKEDYFSLGPVAEIVVTSVVDAKEEEHVDDVPEITQDTVDEMNSTVVLAPEVPSAEASTSATIAAPVALRATSSPVEALEDAAGSLSSVYVVSGSTDALVNKPTLHSVSSSNAAKPHSPAKEQLHSEATAEPVDEQPKLAAEDSNTLERVGSQSEAALSSPPPAIEQSLPLASPPVVPSFLRTFSKALFGFSRPRPMSPSPVPAILSRDSSPSGRASPLPRADSRLSLLHCASSTDVAKPSETASSSSSSHSHRENIIDLISTQTVKGTRRESEAVEGATPTEGLQKAEPAVSPPPASPAVSEPSSSPTLSVEPAHLLVAKTEIPVELSNQLSSHNPGDSSTSLPPLASASLPPPPSTTVRPTSHPQFAALIRALTKATAEGNPRVTRGNTRLLEVTKTLVGKRPLRTHLQAAEEAGVIQTGGEGLGQWVSLKEGHGHI